MDFYNFNIIFVFKVKESIADIPTELPCLSDLENLGQLPVQEVLIILSYIFFWIFTLFMFSRSGNSLLIVLQSYFVWVTTKLQVNFRFKGDSKVLMIVSYGFSQFLYYLCFQG